MGASTLKEIWLTTDDLDLAVIDVLALLVVQEKAAWAKENKSRSTSGKRLVWICCFAVSSAWTELGMLYSFIT